MAVYSTSLFFILAAAILLHIMGSNAVMTESESKYWDKYFSTGMTHELTGIADSMVTDKGIVTTEGYPGEFSRPAGIPARTVTVKTRGYERIVVFYRGDRLQDGKSCSAQIKVGDQIPLCVPVAPDNTSSLPLKSVSHSTKNRDVTIALSFTGTQVANFTGYKIYFQLVNPMTPVSSVLHTNNTLTVPTIVSSDFTFPENVSKKDLKRVSSVTLNVHLYDTITVKLLIVEVAGANCSQAWMQISAFKLCDKYRNVTIDVKTLTNLTIYYNYVRLGNHKSIGMLAHISTGERTRGKYGLCEMNRALLERNLPHAKIFSPNFPFKNSHTIKDCHIKIEDFDLINYRLIGEQLPVSNCSLRKLEIAENIFCTGESFDVTDDIKPDGLTIKYSQNAASPQPPFSIEYQTTNFVDICGGGGSNSPDVLPYRLKSPGFPTKSYAANKFCHSIVTVPGVTNITVTFRKFDLEKSNSCEHDYLKIGNSARMCGKELKGQTLNMTVPKRGFFVQFQSDLTTSGRGFAIEIDSLQYTPPTTTTHAIETTTNVADSTYSKSFVSTDRLTNTEPLVTTLTKSDAQLTTTSAAETAPSKLTNTKPIVTKGKAATDSGMRATTTIGSHTKRGSRTTGKTAHNTKNSGKPKAHSENVKTKPPGYVWAIVAVVIVAACLAAVAGFVIRRRRRKDWNPLLRNEEIDTTVIADVGIENPLYGTDREMERMSLAAR